MSKATIDALDALHGKLAEEMLAKLNSGDCDAATLSAIRQFLKDNRIEAQVVPGQPLHNLAKIAGMNLPFPGEPGEATH